MPITQTLDLNKLLSTDRTVIIDTLLTLNSDELTNIALQLNQLIREQKEQSTDITFFTGLIEIPFIAAAVGLCFSPIFPLAIIAAIIAVGVFFSAIAITDANREKIALSRELQNEIYIILNIREHDKKNNVTPLILSSLSEQQKSAKHTHSIREADVVTTDKDNKTRHLRHHHVHVRHHSAQKSTQPSSSGDGEAVRHSLRQSR